MKRSKEESKRLALIVSGGWTIMNILYLSIIFANLLGGIIGGILGGVVFFAIWYSADRIMQKKKERN
ncbi:hypothetical protein QA612_17360 [Evansella sp. AB-P1]|uniref:hypothetical protein n=1 Tax=Evansella sp. AB-P1 TaxID=3037653 RepID=UPI00241E911E|nr:hypothetical protein [Evansella sp. AB-P1]MDG5789230.1 hypothetical protein [Evansella sp. AB-P1]